MPGSFTPTTDADRPGVGPGAAAHDRDTVKTQIYHEGTRALTPERPSDLLAGPERDSYVKSVIRRW